MSFIPAEAALARIALDHATALKATHKARRRGGDSIARRQCLRSFEIAASVQLLLFIIAPDVVVYF